MPFDWKPSRSTKAVGASDIYRPARGNYALVNAQCRNGATIEMRTYDTSGNQLTRENWLTSLAPVRAVNKPLRYVVRTFSHGNLPSQHYWDGHYTPRAGYIFEGFLYNLSATDSLHYSFESVDLGGALSNYEYLIPRKSGATREFVNSFSRAWLQVGNGSSLYFTPRSSQPQILSSSVIDVLEKSQGLIGYERLASGKPLSSGWTWLDDKTEIMARNSSLNDWSAAVVEYGVP